MNIKHFADKTGFNILCMPAPSKEVNGAYVGDLLSWVMGKATEGNIWITIMSNINIVAVASLTEASCIVLSEGVTLDKDVISVAETKGVNIFSTELSAYNTVKKISEFI